jgi:hypothetical protein
MPQSCGGILQNGALWRCKYYFTHFNLRLDTFLGRFEDGRMMGDMEGSI